MATFRISSGGQTFQVDAPDAFLQLPQDQQNAELAAAFEAHQGASVGIWPSPAGIPPTPPDGPLATPPAGPSAAPDDTLTGAFTNGVKSAAHGLGETAKLANLLPGWVPGRQTIASAGQSLEDTAGAPTASVPAVGSAISAAKAGHWGQAGYEALRAAAGALPDIGGALAADVVPGGALAYLGARNLGDTADARAANNGRSAPTVADALSALPSTAAQAIIGRYGLGKAAGGLPQGIRQAAQVGMEGAAGAASDVAGQLGASAGTNKGAQVDPTEAAEVGLQGAAGRAASLVPGVGQAGLKNATDAVMSRTIAQSASPDHAASIDRVGTMFNQAEQAAKATKGDVSPLAVMNNVKSELLRNLQGTIGGLRDVGLLDGPQARQTMAAIQDQALRHNNTIASGQPGGAQTLFDRINALDLPDQVVQPLIDGVRDLDTVSTQSFAKNQTGPFQQIGRVVGNYGGAAYELAHGSPVGALAMMALGKTHAGAGIGGAIGSQVDNLVGTNTPRLLLQRAAARRMLGDSYQPSDTLQGLQNVQDAIASQPPPAKPPVFNGPEVGVQYPPDLTPASRAAAGNAELARQARAQALQQANLAASANAQDQANGQQQAGYQSELDKWLGGKTTAHHHRRAPRRLRQRLRVGNRCWPTVRRQNEPRSSSQSCSTRLPGVTWTASRRRNWTRQRAQTRWRCTWPECCRTSTRRCLARRRTQL